MLEPESPRITLPAGLVSGETCLPGLQMVPFSLRLHMVSLLCVCRERDLASLPLTRTLILSEEGPTQMTSFNLNYILKGPISKYSHIGN